MSTRRRRHAVAAVVAGVGAFVVQGWPDLLLWRAGASGAIGDIAEEQVVAAGLATAAALGVVVAVLFPFALDRAERSPRRGRFDAWGAYALGLGVHSLVVVTVGPLTVFLVILDDENRLPLPGPAIAMVWVGLRVVAVLAGLAAARLLIGPAPAGVVTPDGAG